MVAGIASEFNTFEMQVYCRSAFTHMAVIEK